MKGNIPMAFVAYMILCTNAICVNLSDAVKQKKIEAKVCWKGMESMQSVSRRHGTNIKIMLRNLTSGNLNIEIPSGFMFTPLDSSKQNMIITDELIVILEPGKQKINYAHGYCCEATDGAPEENEVYLIKKPAEDKLKKVAQYIGSNNLSGYGVQRAIWCMSNNHDLWGINTGDTTATKKLIKYIAEIKGIPEVDANRAIKKALNNDYKIFEQYIPIEVTLNKETLIWIMVQDINNNTVRYALTKERFDKGVLKSEIGVSSIDLGAGDFYIRVYSEEGFLAEKKFRLDI